MSAHTPTGRKIVTEYWMKPIPDRSCDWSAVTEDYDGAEDAHPSNRAQGFGRTEPEAIADLLEQLDAWLGA